MFTKSKGPGQPGQFIRVCACCERVYLKSRPCPKCDFAHYGAPWTYDSWFWAIWYLITQLPYRRKAFRKVATERDAIK